MKRRGQILIAIASAIVATAIIVAVRCVGERADRQSRSTSSVPTAGRTFKPPPKTASIAGVVIDETRAPIAGARICADADSQTLEAELIREPRCTITDARGAYVVRELYAANYAV
ncbi:MAG TPA: carboxypeptidase-like regulatory domain-containing protein, partial [Kofleriaceae bacterium]